jgi:hypothetical protein
MYRICFTAAVWFVVSAGMPATLQAYKAGGVYDIIFRMGIVFYDQLAPGEFVRGAGICGTTGTVF